MSPLLQHFSSLGQTDRHAFFHSQIAHCVSVPSQQSGARRRHDNTGWDGSTGHFRRSRAEKARLSCQGEIKPT
ncbi:unnamed protein product [Protopolystoma xenopodis]|uniref:Uncharacterized protein n=1 Tax=Protopolystoma xenopodis TaxID=117903 RepID=A0A3S5FCF2_9PLAT|nr:unnamed protein product [Protopolystoma xenopodis]